LCDELRIEEFSFGKRLESEGHLPLSPQRVAELAAAAWRPELPPGRT